MRRRSLDTIKFLTLEETRRLFKAIGDDKRNRALFLLAYRHGLRASEIGLLRKDETGFFGRHARASWGLTRTCPISLPF